MKAWLITGCSSRFGQRLALQHSAAIDQPCALARALFDRQHLTGKQS